MPIQSTPTEYRAWLKGLKGEIHQARHRAALAVNSEMIALYWKIGQQIIDRQERHGWGARVVDRLAADLRSEFPDIKGFSPRNLKYMRKFALEWPDPAIVQRVVAQLPWGQNVELLDALTTQDERLWYAKAAIEHGWSCRVLAHQIETKLRERQGQAITNFKNTMPASEAPVAINLFKDPYVLDFVELADDAHERHLERELILRIRNLLLELGKGFSFMGSQYHLQVGGDDFYLDLLFYHTKLHRHVVIDLKMEDFKPEFAGKMNFYLAAVDTQLLTEGDNSSIGLILCRGKNGLVVEYALRDMNKPIAVSEYHVLPPQMASALPSPDDLNASIVEKSGSDEDDEREPDGPRTRRQ